MQANEAIEKLRAALGAMTSYSGPSMFDIKNARAVLAATATIDPPAAPVLAAVGVEAQHHSDVIPPSRAEPAGQLDAGGGVDLDKLETLAKAAEQMFVGMHWYTRFQILDGISNDESAALIGALDPDTVLKLITLARNAEQSAPPVPRMGGNTKPACDTCNDLGVVGGHVGQTPESFDYVTEDCPDCPAAQPAPDHAKRDGCCNNNCNQGRECPERK